MEKRKKTDVYLMVIFFASVFAAGQRIGFAWPNSVMRIKVVIILGAIECDGTCVFPAFQSDQNLHPRPCLLQGT